MEDAGLDKFGPTSGDSPRWVPETRVGAEGEVTVIGEALVAEAAGAAEGAGVVVAADFRAVAPQEDGENE